LAGGSWVIAEHDEAQPADLLRKLRKHRIWG
jgi:hypothetical protein